MSMSGVPAGRVLTFGGSQGGECGGAGGWLLTVWPVGVVRVMVTPSGSVVAAQPGASLV